MKTKLKRLMAVLMAVAMVLSLSVTAFAGEDDGDIGDTEVQNLNVGQEDGSSGKAEASSSTEGRIPDDPIDIVLPTVPEPENGAAGLFDMYLDPHELITKTSAARYQESLGVTETTFVGDGQRLYFQSDLNEEGEAVYSGDSKTLTITNKGRLPVTVDLNVDLSYGDATSDDGLAEFDLVGSAADLADATKAPNAAMFLGLKLGNNDPVAVLEPAANAVPTSQVYGKGNYFTSVAFAFANDIDAEAKTALLTALEGEGTSIVGQYVAAVPATETEGAVNAKVTVTPTMDGYTFDHTDLDNGVIAVEEADENSTVKTLAITVKKDTTAVATITVKVLPPNRKTMKETDTENGADYTQTIKFFPHAAGTGKAFIRTGISARTDAYKEQWMDPDTVGADNPAPQGMSDKGYFWAIDPEKATEAEEEGFYPSISFKLTGNINEDVLWDNVSDSQISFTLTWDVFEHENALYKNIEFGDGAANTVKLQGDKPTITVTKKPTSSTAKTLTITWTAGTQDYAAYTPSTTIALTQGTTPTMTMTKSGQTLTYSSAYTTINAAGAGVTAIVTFTADGLPDLELETEALK